MLKVLFLAVAMGAVGCAQPAQFPSESEVECVAAVLQPALKTGYDAEALARRVVAKQASADEVLTAIKDDLAVAKATIKAVEACSAPPDAGK